MLSSLFISLCWLTQILIWILVSRKWPSDQIIRCCWWSGSRSKTGFFCSKITYSNCIKSRLYSPDVGIRLVFSRCLRSLRVSSFIWHVTMTYNYCVHKTCIFLRQAGKACMNVAGSRNAADTKTSGHAQTSHQNDYSIARCPCDRTALECSKLSSHLFHRTTCHSLI